MNVGWGKIYMGKWHFYDTEGTAICGSRSTEYHEGELLEAPPENSKVCKKCHQIVHGGMRFQKLVAAIRELQSTYDELATEFGSDSDATHRWPRDTQLGNWTMKQIHNVLADLNAIKEDMKGD